MTSLEPLEFTDIVVSLEKVVSIPGLLMPVSFVLSAELRDEGFIDESSSALLRANE